MPVKQPWLDGHQSEKSPSVLLIMRERSRIITTKRSNSLFQRGYQLDMYIFAI